VDEVGATVVPPMMTVKSSGTDVPPNNTRSFANWGLLLPPPQPLSAHSTTARNFEYRVCPPYIPLNYI
jgi:hypothetical protein